MKTRDRTKELKEEQLCCKQDRLQNIYLAHTHHILCTQQKCNNYHGAKYLITKVF